MTVFLTISEGNITSADSYREIIGQEENGKPKFGAMKLKQAKYTYPKNLDINTKIKETINGNIYKRVETD